MKTLILFLLIAVSAHGQIQYDKKAHFVAGAWVSACTYPVAYSITKDRKKAFLVSLGVSTLVGVGKEVFDSTREGNKFDTADLGATVLGGFMVSITFEISK